MRFVLLLVAAVIAVVAGVVALQWGKSEPAPQPQAGIPQASQSANVATVDILVARQPISVGTVIDDSMVDKQPWPQHLVLDGFIVSGNKDSNITGRVARSNFQAREPFMTSKLANPNDPSFLAATLEPGMRAVTLATDSISGVAGYVFPGDRVDVMLTHNVPSSIRRQSKDQETSLAKPVITEVMIPNIRVLAVNVRQPAGKENQASLSPSSVTVEVTEEDAQKLRLAEKQGSLALALRPIKDKDDGSVPEPTVLKNLTHLRIEESAETAGVKVVRGAGPQTESGTLNTAKSIDMKSDEPTTATENAGAAAGTN